MCILLAADLLCGGAVPAMAAEPPASSGVRATLDDCHELIKKGDYDLAIERLKATIGQPPPDPELLREAYLSLIESIEYKAANDGKRPDGLTEKRLLEAEADRLIAECLSNKALRHTRPDETRYPEDMVRRFKYVRAQHFGGVRVTSVDPAWKIQTAFGSPWASSVRVPVIANELGSL